jgi:hypothetical protein
MVEILERFESVCLGFHLDLCAQGREVKPPLAPSLTTLVLSEESLILPDPSP